MLNLNEDEVKIVYDFYNDRTLIETNMNNNTEARQSAIQLVIKRFLCKLDWNKWDGTFSDMNQNCKRCNKYRYLDIHGDKRWHIIG